VVTKNIVLLSDGTGNSSSSPFKTNVWRLYQAIDLAPGGAPRQLVYYDNGVGTENFKPIAALGGALGLGVWQNVRDLYTFVCRNYESGDNIYGFGFSRGAFTIRLLMGLIGKCGLLKADSEADLLRCVQSAYEAYRRDYLIRASRRRNMLYHYFLREPKRIPGNPSKPIDLSGTGCTQAFTDIRFVGVWDTVDAYGMPVDEIKLAIDEYAWPMSFADRDPSTYLATIRHALSLDDERPTFRPVLWNEVLPPKHPGEDREVISPQRIQQVWFAGVHANVGGGYPDDGLAFTSLKWMMDEAEKCGLRYDKLIRQEINAHVNPEGEQYDSRSGIAGYYRYGPRQVGALCNDPAHGVTVPTVRVHPAAYERIAAWRRDYEPVSLDCAFDVDGIAKAAADDAAMQNAWDLVWWRRLSYFLTMALTAFIALFATLLFSHRLEFLFAAIESVLDRIWLGLTGVIGAILPSSLAVKWNGLVGYIDSAVPHWIATGWGWIVGAAGFGWASPVGNSFADYPLTAIVSFGLLAWSFFVWSGKLERRIEVLAEWAWASHKGLGASARPVPDWRNYVARVLRPVTSLIYRWLWRGLFVRLFGLAALVIVLVVWLPFWIWIRRPVWMA
jgi:hypothetical protein